MFSDSTFLNYFSFQSGVQVLTLIQEMLPHVAALNLLSTMGSSQISQDSEVQSHASPPITTSHHYTWLESDRSSVQTFYDILLQSHFSRYGEVVNHRIHARMRHRAAGRLFAALHSKYNFKYSYGVSGITQRRIVSL